MTKRRSLRFASMSEMPASMQRLAARALGATPATTPPGKSGRANKYGNQVTHVDGIRFDSKREARYYTQLKLRQQAGEVSYWLRQVPLHLPGGTRYVVDFLVFYADGRAPEYVDVKGRQTQTFRVKKREVEHHYPIKVVLA